MSGMRIFLILLLLVSGAPANSIIQGLNVSTIEVMEGGRVDLPCNISPLRSSDKVSLILWFKEDEGKPIYSVEVPPGSDLGSLPPQSYWSSSDHFSSRARFRGDELSLTGLKSVESGTYRLVSGSS
ncbi:uncharacterized protein LOC111706165 [Eurytemora carolleeae]|uniref:uncharacterized protein LOC111706165 n=1 Tax=Eurytemora carolleeae TaxID=1294199 RepID=UPI000C77BC1B|nr:uncharacterized protein LOC111706165 [Eurytemora carolleeae]|eukprot:XP_023334725.1 uncharacterized protein LOC111706165 [Eurytemora affinis]